MNITSIRSSISSLKKKYHTLKKSSSREAGRLKLESFLNETYKPPLQTPKQIRHKSKIAGLFASDEAKALCAVNLDLSSDLVQVNIEKDELDKKHQETEAKLQNIKKSRFKEL